MEGGGGQIAWPDISLSVRDATATASGLVELVLIERWTQRRNCVLISWAGVCERVRVSKFYVFVFLV